MGGSMDAMKHYLAINMTNTFLVDNCTFGGCNKHCEYCRGSREIKGDKAAVEKSLSILEENVNASILKISGYGEITMIKDWKNIIGKHNQHYTTTQIITNATLLTSYDIDWLASRDYCLCVSLDGVSVPANSPRSSSEAELARIKMNLGYASSLGIPLEINTVITSRNIKELEPLLDFVASINGICYPFPVRENRLYSNSNYLNPSKEDVEKNIGGLSKNFHPSLPPRSYIEGLTQFMLEGTRGVCYVPKIIVGISPEGDLLWCPCSGNKRIANIFLEGKEAFDKQFEQRSYGGYNKECEDCFTHYDILNLFLDGKISQEEMRRLPLFKKQDLIKLKGEYGR
jgi:MoaA/NifB/PqqE/SkfB family radical SAM enzyme